jgi:hypothetical protein
MTTEDRLNVAETVYRYAYGVDTRDFALYRSIFAERVAVDFTSFNGGEAIVMSADQWVAGVRSVFTRLAATQHSMTNPITSIEGDTAACRMYVQAHHVYDATCTTPTILRRGTRSAATTTTRSCVPPTARPDGCSRASRSPCSGVAATRESCRHAMTPDLAQA